MHHLNVTQIKHYTDHLFSFQTTRPQNFRFQSGEFVMIGLEQDKGKPLMRAYSIASPKWEEHLEFYSIKVEDGALTSRLRSIQCGDRIIAGKKAVGTLVYDALEEGQNLYLLSTGTGIAPFASIIRDPETYEKFEHVILVHCCRTRAELGYGFDLITQIKEHEILCEIVSDKLSHYTSVTREDYPVNQRIPALIESHKLFDDLGLPALDKARDRVMICGSPAMLADMRELLDARGFAISPKTGVAGDYVIERAFVER